MPTANTLTVSDQIITLAFDGSTNDLNFATYFPAGVRVISVGFIASAVTDVLVLKERSDSGATLAQISNTGSANFPTPFDCFPYLDYSACTFGTPANVKVIVYII